MEKAKLPKEVAEAIDVISRQQNWKTRIIECMFDNERSLSDEMKRIKKFFFYQGDNSEIILQALVNGYEVEQTPEDKVRGIWEKYIAPYNGIGANAICEVLDALNIQISGVNAE